MVKRNVSPPTLTGFNTLTHRTPGTQIPTSLELEKASFFQLADAWKGQQQVFEVLFHYNVEETCRNLSLVYISQPMVKLFSFCATSLKDTESIYDIK